MDRTIGRSLRGVALIIEQLLAQSVNWDGFKIEKSHDRRASKPQAKKNTGANIALKRAQTKLKPLLCEHVVSGPWSHFFFYR